VYEADEEEKINNFIMYEKEKIVACDPK